MARLVVVSIKYQVHQARTEYSVVLCNPYFRHQRHPLLVVLLAVCNSYGDFVDVT